MTGPNPNRPYPVGELNTDDFPILRRTLEMMGPETTATPLIAAMAATAIGACSLSLPTASSAAGNMRTGNPPP